MVINPVGLGLLSLNSFDDSYDRIFTTGLIHKRTRHIKCGEPLLAASLSYVDTRRLWCRQPVEEMLPSLEPFVEISDKCVERGYPGAHFITVGARRFDRGH